MVDLMVDLELLLVSISALKNMESELEVSEIMKVGGEGARGGGPKDLAPLLSLTPDLTTIPFLSIYFSC